MSLFGLFRKKKEEIKPELQPQEEKPASQEQPAIAAPEAEPAQVAGAKPVTEQPTAEEKTTTEQQPTIEEKPQITPPAPAKIETEPITYLRAMPLHELADIENVENEVKKGNIVILRITPLASKSIDDVKQAVDQLYAFAESVKGDIARLGEERIVICPEKIRIWREKTPKATAPLPTAA